MATTPANLLKKPLSPFQKIDKERSAKSVMSGADMIEQVNGGVKKAGQIFPTTLPGYIPRTDTTKLKFNEDGTVEVTPKGSKESFTLSKEEYKQTLPQSNVIQPTPAATPNLELLRQAETGEQNVDLSKLGQVSDLPLDPNVTTGDLSFGEKAGILTRGAAYAGIGAGIGSVVPGVGTAIGAGLGFGVGALTSLFSAIESDRAAVASGAYSNFKFSKSQSNTIINLANSGQIDAIDAVDAYNRDLQNIRLARNYLKETTKDLTGDKLAKAQADLTNIEIYLEYEPLIRQKLALALTNPNPAAISNLNELQTLEE